MRMGEIDIHDYARQLLEAHGEMASLRPLRRLEASRRRVKRRKLKRGDTSKQR